MVEVKFCGLTRAVDAARAAEFGAAFAGVIFAGGPRHLSAERAQEVLAPLAGSGVRRVGVFGDQPAAEVASTAHAAAVDVVQLHGGISFERLQAVRAAFGGIVWAVARIEAGRWDATVEEWLSAADGLVLDAALPGRLGGTGVVLDWAAVRHDVARVRSVFRATVVLAGGLRPGNVAEAIRVVRPQVVDVSSGVESAPGVKDPELMRAFAANARTTPDEER